MQPFQHAHQNRREAGRELAGQLLNYRDRPNALVLAVSRSGVLVGDGIAESLRLPLDIFGIRGVGVPGYEETRMGVVARGTYLPNMQVINGAGLSMQAFVEAASAEQKQLDQQETFYRNNRPAPTLIGRAVILVDDGLTPESDLPAAVEALRRHGPAEIVVAVPVTTAAEREKILTKVQGFVNSYVIDDAASLEPWYEDTNDVDDAQVRATLEEAAERFAGRPQQA